MAKKRKATRKKKDNTFKIRVKSDKQYAKDFQKTFKSGKGGGSLFKGM